MLVVTKEIPTVEVRQAVLEKLARLADALQRAEDVWEKDPPAKHGRDEPSWLEELLSATETAEDADGPKEPLAPGQ